MTINERTAKATTLLTLLATVPAFVFDIVDFKLYGEYHLHPLLVEQLLYRRGQFNGRLSLKENLEKHYGKQTAQLAEELI